MATTKEMAQFMLEMVLDDIECNFKDDMLMETKDEFEVDALTAEPAFDLMLSWLKEGVKNKR